MKVPRKLFHLESQTILRDIVKRFLEDDSRFSYSSGDPEKMDFLSEVPLASIDVLILGFNLSDRMHGSCSMLSICKYVKEYYPFIQIIAHSSYSAKGHFVQLIKAGVSAVVSKSEGWQQLQEALHEVAHGRQYIDGGHADIVLNAQQFVMGQKAKMKYDRELFSDREVQVLSLVAQGFRTSQIAQCLFITEKTVETHRKSLVVKSATKNTAQMIFYSHSHGLL